MTWLSGTVRRWSKFSELRNFARHKYGNASVGCSRASVCQCRLAAVSVVVQTLPCNIRDCLLRSTGRVTSSSLNTLTNPRRAQERRLGPPEAHVRLTDRLCGRRHQPLRLFRDTCLPLLQDSAFRTADVNESDAGWHHFAASDSSFHWRIARLSQCWRCSVCVNILVRYVVCVQVVMRSS